MKRLIIIAMVLGVASVAQASNMQFTCKNSDSSIILTREKLVLVRTNLITKQEALRILDNLQVNSLPAQNEIIEFDPLDGGAAVSLKIKSKSVGIIIAEEDGGECDGGRGPGFSTEQYTVNAEFLIDGQQTEPVNLTCLESYFWSGSCRFE